MNKSLWLTASLIFLVFLGACTAQPTPTSTPIPSATPRPTATLAPVQLSLGTRLNVYDRFSFQGIETYPYNLTSPGIFIGNLQQDIKITFVLFDSEADGFGEGERFLASLDQSFANYELGQPEATEVNGFAATTATLGASAGGFELDGRYVLVEFEDGDQFVGLALGDTSGGRDAWTLEGSSAFELMLETVEFGPSEEIGTVCVVSTDPTYGFSEDNPIRVGGLSLEEFNFSGLDRETVFFDNLLGPNGEPVSYERSGSLSSGDTILDAFLLTSSGFSDTRTLYIDAYNFQELFAPVGFTCAGRFTISAP